MQVNSINSISYANRVNQNSYQKQNSKQSQMSAQEVNFMGEDKKSHKAMGPLLAVMMIPAIATVPSSCIKMDARAKAQIIQNTGSYPITPVDNDTVVVRDTIVIPATYEFPQEIHDSLNYWRGGVLGFPTDDASEAAGDFSNKVLASAGAIREWDFQRPEYLKMNLAKSKDNEAYYDHIIRGNEIYPDSVANDVRVTVVRPNEIVVKRLDGSESNTATGLLFNEDGKKIFIHSAGNKLHIYKKDVDRESENFGKFVELGTAEHGDLDESEDGLNVKLFNLLGTNTIDYFTHGAYTVMSRDELENISAKVRAALLDD